MFSGAHLLFYSVDPAGDRAFLRDVLGFRSVDLGEGWLVFRLPPAEAAVHPAGAPFAMDHAGAPLMGAVLYLMCGDLEGTVARLAGRGVSCAPVVEAPWGRSTTFALPSGAALGLYRPSHELAIEPEG